MNNYYKFALGVSFCLVGLAIFCEMVAFFGLVVTPKSWGWLDGTGTLLIEAAMASMSLGVMLALLSAAVGFLSDYWKAQP